MISRTTQISGTSMIKLTMMIGLITIFFVNSANAIEIRKDEIAYVEEFISKYGKSKVVDLIRSERNGYITLNVEDELIDYSGRPNVDFVTAYTVCVDINKIGWNVIEFRDKLMEGPQPYQRGGKTKKFTGGPSNSKRGSQAGSQKEGGKEIWRKLERKYKNSKKVSDRFNIEWARSPYLGNQTVICKNGDCENGYGHGVWLHSGGLNPDDYYEGYWINGRMHGQGKYFTGCKLPGITRGIWKDGNFVESFHDDNSWNYVLEAKGIFSIALDFYMENYGSAKMKYCYGDFHKARELCTKAIKINSSDINAYLLRGKSNLMVSSDEDAIDDFNIYLHENALDIDSRWLKTHCHILLNQPLKAMDLCNEILLLMPNHKYALFLRAELEYYYSDFDKALKDYTDFLELEPNSDIGYMRRGRVWECKGNIENALKDYLEAKTCIDYIKESYIQGLIDDIYNQLKTSTWDRLIKSRGLICDEYNRPYNGEAVASFSNGKTKLKANFKGGKLNGRYIHWDTEGRKKFQMNFVNGKISGKFIVWYKSGGNKFEACFDNDKLNGPCILRHENKAKMSQVNFNNGKLNGKYVLWHDNSTKKAVIQYKDGKIDGKSLQWYKNGNMSSKAYFDNGLLDGKYYYWHKNGNLAMKASFDNGKRNGAWRLWNQDDIPLLKISYDNDIPESIKSYHKKVDKWIMISDTVDMDKFDYWADKSQNHYKSKSYWEALSSLLIAHEIKPNRCEITDLISEIFQQLELFDMSIYFAEKTTSLNDNIADVNYDLASLYFKQGNIIESIKFFRKYCTLEKYNIYNEIQSLIYPFLTDDILMPIISSNCNDETASVNHIFWINSLTNKIKSHDTCGYVFGSGAYNWKNTIID